METCEYYLGTVVRRQAGIVKDGHLVVCECQLVLVEWMQGIQVVTEERVGRHREAMGGVGGGCPRWQIRVCLLFW